MKARDLALFLGLLASTALGQTTKPADSTSTQWTGTVRGTNVRVRAEPSLRAYICTQVSEPTSLTVTGVSGEFFEILPTAGTYSVVLKRYVQLDAGGASGVINQDDVLPRPAGDKRDADFNSIHRGVKLSKGAKVKILGDAGAEYYKIEPPAGARFYIAAEFVNGAPGVAARVPTTNPVDTSTVRVIKPTTTAPAPDVNKTILTSKEVEEFKALEDALQAEFKKDAAQIDVKGLIARYQALSVKDDAMKQIVDYRVAYLKAILDQKSNATDLKEAQARMEKLIKETLTKVSDIKPDVVPGVGQMRYLAEGTLMASALFPGGATGPKRYVIVDPFTQRTDAYVQCSAGNVKLDDFVGKYVGVGGKQEYDKGMRRYVVDVQTIDDVVVLKDKAEIPVPAAPGISVSGKKEEPKATPVAPPTMPLPPVEPKVEPTPEPATAPAGEPKIESTTTAPAGASAGTGEVVMEVTPAAPKADNSLPPIPESN